MTAYLSVCAIYKDEAPYLREWVEFHRLVGVERFFLYDNESTDGHEAVLAPYVAEGIVVPHRSPGFPAQVPAYNDCLKVHGGESRWIAFIDLDEFLFSPTTWKVSERLRDYEQWSGVGVHWALFGTSGHDEKPDGLVIESYTSRSDDVETRKWLKSVVDPSRTQECTGAHTFRYSSGVAVDEEHRELKGPGRGATSLPATFAKLRLNHYATKSYAEWRERQEKGWPGGRFPRPRYQRHPDVSFGLDAVTDRDILKYLPSLRKALGIAARNDP